MILLTNDVITRSFFGGSEQQNLQLHDKILCLNQHAHTHTYTCTHTHTHTHTHVHAHAHPHTHTQNTHKQNNKGTVYLLHNL